MHVPDGKILRPGMKDARVVSLRKRLDIAGDKDNPLYDDEVRDAVKTFQTETEIAVDGNLGPNTVRALNGEKKVAHGPSTNLIDTIIVNMERWRWMPRNLGNPHVIVNVPEYTLTLYNDGKVYWHTKIVAGKPGKATPMVSAEMKFITVNPTWNVPPSIIENEYLPALQADPQALDRIGLKITQDADGTIHIWQPPGAGNALGRIRFNFPNKFLVYQHDTPDKYLFAREKRAYSHGCMRVQNPLTYGEKLLSLVLPNEHYTEARLEEMFGGSEININFPKIHPGAPDLSDRLRGRSRQAAVARGCLWPRCQNDRDPQGQRAQGRRHRDRASRIPRPSRCACRSVCMAAVATIAARASSNSCSADRGRLRRSQSIGHPRPSAGVSVTMGAIRYANRIAFENRKRRRDHRRRFCLRARRQTGLAGRKR